MIANKSIWIGAVAGVLVVSGCAKNEAPAPEFAPVQEEVAETAEMTPAPTVARATLHSRADTTASGWVTFTQTDAGVDIEAHIEGLSPGLHGFHVHATGDCSSEDFKSTGGHFNPTEVPHGAPSDTEHHAGDLGNVEVGEDGSAHLIASSTMLTLDDGPNSVIGRGVIVHEKADDLESQPTGAAGSRVACGVVALEEEAYAEKDYVGEGYGEEGYVDPAGEADSP